MDNQKLQNLQNQIEDLEKRIEQLESKRIYQQDITPAAVKMRHMGEGNMYIWAGLEANLPKGNTVPNSTILYFCTDSHKLKIWDGSVFRSVILT